MAATPTVSSDPEPHVYRDARANARDTHGLARLFLLACAGLVLQISWVMVWVLSYHLTHGERFTYAFLVNYPAVWERLHDLVTHANLLVPGIEPPESLDVLVNSLAMAFVIGALGYLAALVLLDRGISGARHAVWVILGWAAIFQTTLYLLPGLYTTDIFSYVMYGHIAGVYGFNPYLYPPNAFPANPMLEWIHPIWQATPSVYGPLWTQITAPLARLIEPLGMVEQVFAYKLVMNVAHLVNLGLVWWLLGRMDGGERSHSWRLTAFTLFAWNPLLLFEVTGNGHNDGLMLTFLLLGLVPLVRTLGRERSNPRRPMATFSTPAWIASLLAVTLSALVKYTTGVVGLFYLTVWVRQMPRVRDRILWPLAAGILLLAVAVGLMWPWLKVPEVFRPILEAASGKLYTNSVPDVLALTLADQVIDPTQLDQESTQEAVRYWTKVVTRGLFVLYLGWELRRLWLIALDRPARVVRAILAASVRAFLVMLLLVLTWVLSWYFTWPLALATLLGWRSTLTRVVVGYTLTSLPIFYVHHYWNWHMPGALLFLYALPPLLPVAWHLWTRSRPSPAAAWPAQKGSLAVSMAGTKDESRFPVRT